MDSPILVTPGRAAEILQISRSKLYELLAAGTLGSIKIGSSRRIRTDELIRFVEELENDG